MAHGMTQTRFFNRDLSLLRFHRRVLEEAQDARNPLLERCKFLAIVSSNLDEFCMVRFAELRRQDPDAPPCPAGLSPVDQEEGVRVDMHQLITDQYACWNQEIEPLLADENIALVRREDWSDEQRQSLRQYYLERVEPVLTPLGVDVGRPFPWLPNGSIVVMVEAEEKDHQRKPAPCFY